MFVNRQRQCRVLHIESDTFQTHQEIRCHLRLEEPGVVVLFLPESCYYSGIVVPSVAQLHRTTHPALQLQNYSRRDTIEVPDEARLAMKGS